jgi:hypothetical protein
LVYEKEVVVPTKFITPSLYTTHATHITDDESIAQRIEDLEELEEARFLADFHHTVEKARQKFSMTGILSPKYSRKGIRYYFTTTNIRNTQASCTCIGWVHS